MGQSQSSSYPKYPQFIQNYKVVHPLQPIRNQLTFLHCHQDNQFALRQIKIKNKHENIKISQKVAIRRTLKTAQLVTVIDACTKQSSLYCSSQIIQYLIIDLPHKTLLQQFNKRIQTKQKFYQQDIWSILVSVVFGMAALQKNRIRHQSLSLDTIYMTPSGQIKVSDPWLIGNITNVKRYQAKSQDFIYIPPYWNQHILIEQQQSYKGDVLTFAIIILSLGLMRNLNSQSPIIQMRYIPKLIKQLQQKVSKQLINLIQKMTSKQLDRPDWIAIEQAILQGQQLQQRQVQINKQKERQQQLLLQTNKKNNRAEQKANIKNTFIKQNKQTKPLNKKQTQMKTKVQTQTQTQTQNNQFEKLIDFKVQQNKQDYKYFIPAPQQTFKIFPTTQSDIDVLNQNPRHYPRQNYELITMFNIKVQKQLYVKCKPFINRIYQSIDEVIDKSNENLNKPYIQELVDSKALYTQRIKQIKNYKQQQQQQKRNTKELSNQSIFNLNVFPLNISNIKFQYNKAVPCKITQQQNIKNKVYQNQNQQSKINQFEIANHHRIQSKSTHQIPINYTKNFKKQQQTCPPIQSLSKFQNLSSNNHYQQIQNPKTVKPIHYQSHQNNFKEFKKQTKNNPLPIVWQQKKQNTTNDRDLPGMQVRNIAQHKLKQIKTLPLIHSKGKKS